METTASTNDYEALSDLHFDREEISDAIEELVERHVAADNYDSKRDMMFDEMLAVTCKYYGHLIADDHCQMKEHRYCVYCRELEIDILRRESQ